ncbi:MAG: TIGR02117 family protein [Cytophagaceae bacterium]
MKRKYTKAVLWSIGILPVLTVVYLAFAIGLSLIPVNTTFTSLEEGIEIYVTSNGVHTDLVLPATNEVYNWKNKIPDHDFQSNDAEFVSFGWGDKGFYLDTPTWSDLKFSTAFKAAFWLGTSAMHVTMYKQSPELNEKSKMIRISPEQYLKLVEYIDASFQKDPKGNILLIPGRHYDGVDDNFYEGTGRYNLFKTCNCWTGKGLKIAGVRTALWSPFEKSIMYHL